MIKALAVLPQPWASERVRKRERRNARVSPSLQALLVLIWIVELLISFAGTLLQEIDLHMERAGALLQMSIC